jgi:NDP-sugar pyrophosphorylase family protein
VIHAAMIMAGGSGARMRQSGASSPKALVEVAGASLLLHNFLQLVGQGWREIYVSTSVAEPEVGAYVKTVLQPCAERHGVVLATIEERFPRGNIGAVADIGERTDPLLVTYADNLSILDLRALSAYHAGAAAAITLAVHEQVFTMPFGEIRVEAGRVIGYHEKPSTRYLVSSAITVIGREARRLVEAREAVGLGQLVSRAIAHGLPVEAYRHNAPWIDVNDLDQLLVAERLAESHPGMVPGARKTSAESTAKREDA